MFICMSMFISKETKNLERRSPKSCISVKMHSFTLNNFETCDKLCLRNGSEALNVTLIETKFKDYYLDSSI